jgi:hypothetical protein
VRHPGAGADTRRRYNGAVADSGSPGGHTDVDYATFDTLDHPYATAIRRRGSSSSGPLDLTMTSDSELGRATGGRHELRSAGVYLTLTNN